MPTDPETRIREALSAVIHKRAGLHGEDCSRTGHCSYYVEACDLAPPLARALEAAARVLYSEGWTDAAKDGGRYWGGPEDGRYTITRDVAIDAFLAALQEES